MKSPKTLQEAIVYFSDSQRAFDYAVRLGWPDGMNSCPRCGYLLNCLIKTRQMWSCGGCGMQFNIKTGTIFEGSLFGIDKWMAAFWMLTNCKNDISSSEIASSLGVTQETAWLMVERLRSCRTGVRGHQWGRLANGERPALRS